MDLVVVHVVRERRESGKNRDHFCFSDLDFLPSEFCFSFCSAGSLPTHRAPLPPLFPLSADDVGAPFERMLLVPLPWHFATCWEDVLALLLIP